MTFIPMFQKLIKDFSVLSLEAKSMAYIRWINMIRTLVLGIFTNIFVYQVYGSIPSLIISNIVYLFWSALWFWIGGIIIHFKEKTNIKHIFYIAFLLFVIWFLLMPLIWHTLWWVMIFFLIVGTGSGMFYFGTTNYEGIFLDDTQRNFYSSALNAWLILVKILTPMLVALFFWVASWWSIDGYTILFIATWLIYLYWIQFIRYIPDHHVEKTSLQWLRKYFKWNKSILASSSFFGLYGLDKWVKILFSILLILILKSEISIGMYEWILNIIAVFIMIFIWVKATQKQQDHIFLGAAILFIVICVLVWWTASLYTLIIYSLGVIILEPILVSMRLADFYRHQDIINKNGSMHLWVIYSETRMEIGRILFLWIVLLISYYVDTTTIIAWWMSIFSLCYLFLYRNAKTFLSKT